MRIVTKVLSALVSTALGAGIAAAHAETFSYVFDTAGRLTGANYGSDRSTTYQYDAAGNLARSTDSLVAADADQDGMNDAWELQYFGTLARDGSGDFDGDGTSDLAEFIAGTDPLVAGSNLRIIRITRTPGVNATVEWTSVAGKTYRLQYKSALDGSAWLNLPGEITATNDTASALDNSLTGVPQRFYRVTVATGPPPTLSATRSNDQVIVSWPSSAPAGFALESATHLAPVALWTAVTNSVADDGARKSVVLPINPNESRRFFRLRE
jgi:YD repeat-containing protein